jgi:hypothetical protein
MGADSNFKVDQSAVSQYNDERHKGIRYSEHQGETWDMLEAERKALAGRKAPTSSAASSGAASAAGTTIDVAQEQEMRAKQMAAAARLDAAAEGRGPSIAGSQLQAGIEASLKAQQAASATNAPRMGAALAMRNYQQGAAAQQQGAALGAAQIKAQEAQAAQAQYAQMVAAMRGQDQSIAAQQAGLTQQTSLANAGYQQQTNLANAGFQQQTSLANQQASLAHDANADAAAARWRAMQMAKDEDDRAAAQAYYGILDQGRADSRARKEASAARDQQMVADTAKVAAMAFAASDERVKTDIKPGGEKVEQFLRAVGAHDYEYKNPDAPLAGRGRFVSPMAQEIEKTEIGRSAVITEPGGRKIVDYGKLLGAITSSVAHVNRKVDALSGKR